MENLPIHLSSVRELWMKQGLKKTCPPPYKESQHPSLRCTGRPLLLVWRAVLREGENCPEFSYSQKHWFKALPASLILPVIYWFFRTFRWNDWFTVDKVVHFQSISFIEMALVRWLRWWIINALELVFYGSNVIGLWLEHTKPFLQVNIQVVQERSNFVPGSGLLVMSQKVLKIIARKGAQWAMLQTVSA